MKKLQTIITELRTSEESKLSSSKANFASYVSLAKDINELSDNDITKLIEGLIKDTKLVKKTLQKNISLLVFFYNEGIKLEVYTSFNSLRELKKLFNNGAYYDTDTLEIKDIETAKAKIKADKDGKKEIAENIAIEIKKSAIFKQFAKECYENNYSNENVLRALNSEIAKLKEESPISVTKKAA